MYSLPRVASIYTWKYGDMISVETFKVGFKELFYLLVRSEAG